MPSSDRILRSSSSPSPPLPPSIVSSTRASTSTTSATPSIPAAVSAPASPHPALRATNGPAHTALQNPTISALIVSHIAESSSIPLIIALRPLLAVCKALHPPAEHAIYHTLHLSGPQHIYSLCLTLASTPRLASHVRNFGMMSSKPSRYPKFPAVFWTSIRDALAKMDRLEVLTLTDPTTPMSGNGPGGFVDDDGRFISYIFPENPPFSLKSFTTYIPCDGRLMRFLGTQSELRELTVRETWYDYRQEFNFQYRKYQEALVGRADHHDEEDGSQLEFSMLESFEGPVQLAAMLFKSPLRFLQVHMDRDSVLDILEAFPMMVTERDEDGLCVGNTLKSLNVFNLPHAKAVEAMRMAAKYCPQVLHLGCFPLGDINHSSFHQALVALPSLISLELDLSSWHPQVIPHFQRAICAEMAIYRPTLRKMTIWVGGKRYLWGREDEESGLWMSKSAASGEQGEIMSWKCV